jgi:prepilin-type N-terminal cleavage/methylation domain-containing protein
MNEKGFTLIELLAVILVLGIIAVIAVPTVSNLIEQSKKNAFETGINNVVSAIENECQVQHMEGDPLTTNYTFSAAGVSPSLDIKGKLPTGGSVIVDNECKVALSVTNGKFVASKSTLEDKVTVASGSVAGDPPVTYNVYANGTAVYFNPVTGTKCAAGDAVSTTGTKTGCMKWYAFSDGGTSSDKINLILDHNTTAILAWNSTGSNVSGPTTILAKLQTDTSSWSGVPTRTDNYSVSNGTATYTINYSTYKARLITASEIATITGNASFNELTSPYTGWFYLDSNNHTQTATTTGASNYAWLYGYTDHCTNYGCSVSESSGVYTAGYWTATAIFGDTTTAWCVRNYGDLGLYSSVDKTDYFGLRPVITIAKSNL